MSQAPVPPDLRPSLEATLRFAVASGAWVVEGSSAGLETARPAAHSAPPAEGPTAGASGALATVRSEIGDCRRCRLWQGRTQIVFGVGDPAARLLFVGEGPGEEEDRQGEPFVGKAGQLLNLMIRAIGLERNQVYIANVVKCRPPKNRDPADDEAATCLPFLWAQIEAVHPTVVCALGAHAAGHLLGSDSPISKLRGRPAVIRGFTVLPTYHPAFLLRNPLKKREAWQDLKSVAALLKAGDPAEHRP